MKARFFGVLLTVFVLMAAFISCSKSDGSGSGSGVSSSVNSARHTKESYFGEWQNDQINKDCLSIFVFNINNEMVAEEHRDENDESYLDYYIIEEAEWKEVDNTFTSEETRKDYPKGFEIRGRTKSGTMYYDEREKRNVDEQNRNYVTNTGYYIFIGKDGKTIALVPMRQTQTWRTGTTIILNKKS